MIREATWEGRWSAIILRFRVLTSLPSFWDSVFLTSQTLSTKVTIECREQRGFPPSLISIQVGLLAIFKLCYLQAFCKVLCEEFHVQMFKWTIKPPIKKQNKAQFFHQVNSSTPSPIFLEGDCQAKFIPSSSINCKISTKLYELYNLKYTPTIRKQWWFTNRFKEGYWQRRLPLWPNSPWRSSRFRLTKIFDKQLHLGYPHSIYWPNHTFCQFVWLILLISRYQVTLSPAMLLTQSHSRWCL